MRSLVDAVLAARVEERDLMMENTVSVSIEETRQPFMDEKAKYCLECNKPLSFRKTKAKKRCDACAWARKYAQDRARKLANKGPAKPPTFCYVCRIRLLPNAVNPRKTCSESCYNRLRSAKMRGLLDSVLANRDAERAFAMDTAKHKIFLDEVRLCPMCGKPLPPQTTRPRETCSNACAKARRKARK